MSHRSTLGSSAPPQRRTSRAFTGLLAACALLVPTAATAVVDYDEDPPFIPFFPFQISIAPSNAQMLPANVPIWGFAVNAIYGIQHEVFGFDVGLFNEVEENLIGAEVGVINITREDAIGLQAGMGNAAEGGLQGVQVGAVNFAEDELVGAQLGAGNTAENVTGTQIGIFNYAEDLKGVQFGLLNFNSGGPIFFMPLFNFGW